VERVQAAGLGLEATADNRDDDDNNDMTTVTTATTPTPVQYNVFVLDGTDDDLRAAAPHLMMRVCGAGVTGGEKPVALGSPSSTASQRSGQSSAGQGQGQCLGQGQGGKAPLVR
jgi:hypothetical protein